MSSDRYPLARAGVWTFLVAPTQSRAALGALGWRADFARLLQRDESGSRPGVTPASRGATEKPGMPSMLSGSPDSFEAFVTAHEGPLFAYLWRMTGDEAAAYDLRQETFIRAWRGFDRVRGYDRPAAWLYRVATNLALNYRRDRSGHVSLASVTLDPAASDPSARLVERDLVRATLLALPPRERAALALREGQGLPCDAVAAALGVTPAAARTLLWRARERFRDLYLRADASFPGATRAEGQGGAR